MLIQVVREQLKSAMKRNDECEKNILRVILGESSHLESSKEQGGKPVTEEQVAKILRKLIVSNDETLKNTPDDSPRKPILLRENEIISVLLPKLLSQDEIRQKLLPIEADLKAANDGKAMGLAMKIFKQANDMVDGNDVKIVVTSIKGV